MLGASRLNLSVHSHFGMGGCCVPSGYRLICVSHPSFECQKVVELGKDGKKIGEWRLSSFWFVLVLIGNSA